MLLKASKSLEALGKLDRELLNNNTKDQNNICLVMQVPN